MDNNKVKAQGTLSTINESAHKMLDAMNDIIWNIQPQNDILENIIARMISFASELLEARNISLKYHIADNINHLHLGLGVRHDFFVIFKEAVNNLAKYSEATEAHINLEFLQPYIILSISDNGKGFDSKIIRNGNGLKNMKTRAIELNGSISITSETGNGTKVSLTVNLK